MKNATLPALRVSDAFRHQVEQALGEEETLSAFIEDAVRHEIHRRQARAQFLERGLESARNARETGVYYPAQSVLDELDQMLSTK
ncbi:MULTISPECIES: YlcI/YnfO family protein [unclassified Thioalkalivibrio]|uniref:YlcI/YnfO family protein n=1 Tax=unclassified Thioalkalivibrio TaxID=2621013 RepID=UPI0003751961|nr:MULTISPECIES: YlcI/YnfO family protein [unclassified Thioalkalivibrio]